MASKSRNPLVHSSLRTQSPRHKSLGGLLGSNFTENATKQIDMGSSQESPSESYDFSPSRGRYDSATAIEQTKGILKKSSPVMRG